MQTTSLTTKPAAGWVILAAGWMLAALAALFVVSSALDSPVTPLSLVWLIPPLGVVLVTRDPRKVGIRAVQAARLAQVTLVTFAGMMVVMGVFEAWSHTYQGLVQIALAPARPDPTFAWLARFPGAAGYLGMYAYTLLVSVFAEEVFFRGWLLQWLLGRMGPAWAIGLQALLFSIPQAIAALFMPGLQAVIYVVVYAWLAVGVIGGWAAWRTGSIWPSLLAATLMNLVFTALAVG